MRGYFNRRTTSRTNNKEMNMRKVLVIAIGILLIASSGYGGTPSSNMYASWVDVYATPTTLTLPQNSRNITIVNGASEPITVNISGTTVEGANQPGLQGWVGPSVSFPSTIQVSPMMDVTLYDTISGSLTFVAKQHASPVTVIVTF